MEDSKETLQDGDAVVALDMEALVARVAALKQTRNPALWESLDQKLQEALPSDSLMLLYYEMTKHTEYAEGLLVSHDGEAAESLLYDYVRYSLRYADRVYTEAALAEGDILESGIRAALLLAPLFDETAMVEVDVAIRLLDQAVLVDPRLAGNVGVYQAWLAEA